MKAIVKTEVVYLCLLLATIALIVWQRLGMNISYSYPLTPSIPYQLVNDDINGGRSTAQLRFVDGLPVMDCDIVLSQSFAFCSLILPLLDERGNGLDLSRYDSLKLTLNYQADERDTILVYLINEERFNGQSIERSNLDVVVPHSGIYTYDMPLNQFQVPSWWIFSRTERDISTDAQFDNVKHIQISTGDHRGERQVTIGAISFSFEGKWIRAADLYLYITIAWAITALLQILVFIRRFHDKYVEAQQETERLNEINAFLQIERDKYETQAKHDPLTGCLNRNGSRSVLRRVSRRFRSSNGRAMLIMFDIDRFKSLNDRFGHEEGDLVLTRLVQLIQQHIREQDHLIRWGGEEFVIICEKTSMAGAMTLAENLRALLERAELSSLSQVTASFGVAEMSSLQIESWFQQADKALYQAKHSGRNQVVLATPENNFSGL